MTERVDAFDYDLSIAPIDITLATKKLAKQAAGAVLLPSVIADEHLAALQHEVNSIPADAQRDVHEIKTNKRGVDVEQNYWAYALRLDRGEQSAVDRLPLLAGLAQSLKRVINNDLSGPFARLRQWKPTEMAVHHYDRPTGLGFHFDPEHYWGLIALASLQGESEFHVRGRDDRLSALFSTEPGDVILLRGSNLYSSNDSSVPLPEHSVQNVGEDGRTSFMIRSSSQPAKVFKGFHYANWPSAAEG